MKTKTAMLTLLIISIIALSSMAQSIGNHNDIDPEALIAHIQQVDIEQRAKLQTLTVDATLIEGDRERDGLVEKTHFSKKISIKYLADTAWYHEAYLEYFEKGEKQSDEDCAKAGEKKIKKKAKRKSLDISYPMLKPFRVDERTKYNIEYKGVSPEEVEGFTCHHFRVDALESEAGLINGDFYFEADAFHLVRVEFSPSKKVSNLMFKMKKLDMSLTFHEATDGIWLPKEFNIDGKGKIGFLFGITFAGKEIYTNPVINGKIDDNLFGIIE